MSLEEGMHRHKIIGMEHPKKTKGIWIAFAKSRPLPGGELMASRLLKLQLRQALIQG